MQAKLLAHAGDVAGAVTRYTELIEHSKDLDDVYVAKLHTNRSLLWHRLGEWNRSKNDAEIAVSRDPLSVKGHHR